MEWLNTNVGSTESTLKQTPEVFESVSVNLSSYVSFRMVNDFMLKVLIQSFIGKQFVGIDGGILSNVLMYDLLQLVPLPALHNLSANLTATFQDANNHCFVSHTNFAFPFVLVNVSSMSTDEGFVYFDSTFTAKFPRKETLLHSKPNAVHHKPSGFLSDSYGAVNLIRANAILAIAQHPNSSQPLIQTERGILEDGSDLDGELPSLVDTLALPFSLILEEHNILAATGGASYDAIRPAQGHHVVKGIVGISKIHDCLLQGLKRFMFAVHDLNHRLFGLIRQVYYYRILSRACFKNRLCIRARPQSCRLGL